MACSGIIQSAQKRQKRAQHSAVPTKLASCFSCSHWGGASVAGGGTWPALRLAVAASTVSFGASTKSEQFKLKTLAVAESACNLNKPEKQTQHCDTVKEELPVAKASLRNNNNGNNNNSSRIKDVTEVEREHERARYALFLLTLAKDMCVGRCQLRLLAFSPPLASSAAAACAA